MDLALRSVRNETPLDTPIQSRVCIVSGREQYQRRILTQVNEHLGLPDGVTKQIEKNISSPFEVSVINVHELSNRMEL